MIYEIKRIMMINLIKYPDKKYWQEIVMRPVIETASLEKSVKKILDRVKSRGDKAVRKYTKEFDRVKLKKLSVNEKEIKAAEKLLSQELKQAIQQAKANIEKFHRAQVGETEVIETMPRIKCWRKSVGIEKVGIYIPGGTAPLFSTVLMLAIPAVLAGCKEIILTSPPIPSPNGEGATVHPAIL
jgi:histidinol dehydrogenase